MCQPAVSTCTAAMHLGCLVLDLDLQVGTAEWQVPVAASDFATCAAMHPDCSAVLPCFKADYGVWPVLIAIPGLSCAKFASMHLVVSDWLLPAQHNFPMSLLVALPDLNARERWSNVNNLTILVGHVNYPPICVRVVQAEDAAWQAVLATQNLCHMCRHEF